MAHILREKPSAVFEYDGDAKALYYRLTREPVARTVSIGDRVNVDVDAAGQAVGIRLGMPRLFYCLTAAEDECQEAKSVSKERLIFIVHHAFPVMNPSPRRKCRGFVVQVCFCAPPEAVKKKKGCSSVHHDRLPFRKRQMGSFDSTMTV